MWVFWDMISKLFFVIICGIKYLNLFLHEIQFGLNEDYFDFYQIHEFIVLEGIFSELIIISLCQNQSL